MVGLKGIVVAGAERSPRLDHLRNAARVRYREPLAPVGDERLLFTTGATNRGTRLVNHVDQLVREAAAVLGSTAKEVVTLALDKLEPGAVLLRNTHVCRVSRGDGRRHRHSRDRASNPVDEEAGLTYAVLDENVGSLL